MLASTSGDTVVNTTILAPSGFESSSGVSVIPDWVRGAATAFSPAAAFPAAVPPIMPAETAMAEACKTSLLFISPPPAPEWSANVSCGLAVQGKP